MGLFDGSGGGGVDSSAGSPEHARARRATDGKPPPGPVDPPDRPGCWRVLLTLLIAAIAVIAVLWVGGELLGPA